MVSRDPVLTLTFTFFRTCRSREQCTGPTKKAKHKLFSFFSVIQTQPIYPKKKVQNVILP